MRFSRRAQARPQAGAALAAHRAANPHARKGVEGLHVSADRAIGAAEPSSVIGGRPVIAGFEQRPQKRPCLLFIAPPHTHPGNASVSLVQCRPSLSSRGRRYRGKMATVARDFGRHGGRGRIWGKIPYETTRYRDGARRRRGKLRGSLWRQRSSPPRAQLGARRQRRKRATPLVVLALAQIGTSSDSAAMNLATASLVGTLGATLDDIRMATTLFSLIAGAFMIAGGLIGVTIGLEAHWPSASPGRAGRDHGGALPRHLLVHLGRARCHGTRRLLGHALGARLVAALYQDDSAPSRSAPSPARPPFDALRP